MARTIREVMTKDPITVPLAATVTEAARKMREADVGAILVVSDGQIQGIVTDRDVTVRCVAEGLIPSATRVGEICSTDLTTLSPSDTLEGAVTLMRQKGVRRLPVVDAGRPVGIVSLGDLALEEEPQSRIDSTLVDISAAPPNT